MVITDGKVHRRSTITTTTTTPPPPLNPVERAYATELASLQKRVKSNPHQDYYYHDTSTTGTTSKWTLKRKRSLTKSNLHHHNKRNNKRSSNNSSNSKPEENEESESPTAVDLISPTGQTHWSTISLTDLLATPRRSDIPDFPGKTDRHVYRDKAYKRARAGLLKSQYSPWDYVSNGALPESASEQQPNKFISPKEKIWWKIQNTAYDRRDADGIMIREGYLTEWYFNAELRGGVWYRQPKMLEPGPRGYVPKAWLYRWVVARRRNNGGECWDGGIGPRDERIEIYCYDHALVGVDMESGNNTEATAAVAEEGSSSSSFMKKISPVLDSTGLSFCRWEKVQQQQQHQLRIPAPPPPQPNPTLPHLPNPSSNDNNKNKKPPTNRKRKLQLQLVPDSINPHPHPNTDDKEPPPPKRHQTHQKKPSTPTPTPTVKATTPKFHYTKEFSAEIDEAGLSIVRWRRRQS